MKILLLTDGIYPYVIGGMQKHSYYLAKFLAQNKVYVDLFHAVPKDKLDINQINGFSDEELDYITHTSLCFPSEGKYPGHYLKESWKYSIELFSLIKTKLNEYDFVYAKGFTAWKLLAERDKGLKCPPIGVNFHGFEMFQKAFSLKARIEQLMLKKPVEWNCKQADFVFSYGGKITNIIKDKVKINLDKIIELPAAIEKDWVNDKVRERTDKIKFLFVGRYERRKGIEEINKVLKAIENETRFEFYFIGPIPAQRKVRSKQVHYYGATNDQSMIREIMQNCDILVCPSHSEGMPNVILEAMASGLAIIATDVGAIAQMVNDTNGWLCNVNNLAELKHKIIEAINEPAEKTYKRKVASRDKIKEKFTWNEVIIKTKDKLSKMSGNNFSDNV